MRYIYVATSEDFVKIGISYAPRWRVARLWRDRTLAPRLREKPVLIHATIGSVKAERLLHQTIAAHRIVGEWYRRECLLEPQVIALLNGPLDLGPHVDQISFRCPPDWKKEVQKAAIDRGEHVEDIVLIAVSKFLKIQLPDGPQ